MTSKKIQGDERQKQAAARQAKRRGKAPSEVDATTGAPKQRRHLGRKADHEDKLAARHRGQHEPPSRGHHTSR